MKGKELNYFKCSSDSLARISQITAVEGGEGQMAETKHSRVLRRDNSNF